MKTKKIASTAVFTALTCVMTLLVRIPMGGGGYINFGDTFIYITAICLGPFAGAFAGGVGSCIADLIGYPIYAPFTLAVKALEGLIVGLIAMTVTKRKLKKPLQITVGVIGMIAGAIVMVAGYFATDVILSTLAGAVGMVVGNIVQASVSVAVATMAIYLGRLRKLSERMGLVMPVMTAERIPPTVDDKQVDSDSE